MTFGVYTVNVAGSLHLALSEHVL